LDVARDLGGELVLCNFQLVAGLKIHPEDRAVLEVASEPQSCFGGDTALLDEEFMAPLGLSMNKMAMDLRVPVTPIADIVNPRGREKPQLRTTPIDRQGNPALQLLQKDGHGCPVHLQLRADAFRRRGVGCAGLLLAGLLALRFGRRIGLP
jgi:hypothetical protein